MPTAEFRDWVAVIAALVASIGAGYVSLKLNPLIKEQERIRDDHEELCEKYEKHVDNQIESYQNFNRWRGAVTAMLEQNASDHKEIKETLKDLTYFDPERKG